MAPSTCMGSDGQVYSAWYDARDDEEGIWFNRSTDGGKSWMTADIRIDRPSDSGGASNPSITCDGARVYVVWEDRRDGELDNANIYFNRSDDAGKSWLAEDIALDADDEGSSMSLGPQIFASSSGVYVAWYDAVNGAYDIYTNSSTDGGESWLSAPVRVDTDEAGEAYSASPVIVADGEGVVIVAWEDSRSGLSDIYVNVSVNHGQSFGASDTRLDAGEAGAADSFRPRLVLSEGHAYVVWHDTLSGDGRDIYLSHSPDSGLIWSSEARRPESTAAGLVDAIFPAIAAVGEELHLAWQDDRSGGYDIFYRRSTDGGSSWEHDEYRIDRDSQGAGQSSRVEIRLSEDDRVVLLWQDYRNDVEAVGFNDLFYGYSVDGGESWSVDDFRVNSNAQGSAYAIDAWVEVWGQEFFFVWADGRFGSSDIFFASHVMGEESRYVAPPEED